MYFDAHNHLQDPRLGGVRGEVLQQLGSGSIATMVVNGTQESDWDAVLQLGHANSRIIPSLGLHPWFVQQRSPQWVDRLDLLLAQTPAHVGEIGLDRWKETIPAEEQISVFKHQLELARKHGRVVTVHCLKAWGPLIDCLDAIPPERFLIHSFNGSSETLRELVRRGAFFSLSGYFAQERKLPQQEIWRAVPEERLLIETDAPDMLGPKFVAPYPLEDNHHQAINHPLNLSSIYQWAASLRGVKEEELQQTIAMNFQKLFQPSPR